MGIGSRVHCSSALHCLDNWEGGNLHSQSWRRAYHKLQRRGWWFWSHSCGIRWEDWHHQVSYFFFFGENFVVMKCVWNFISWTRLLSQCHTMLASLICLDHFNNVWNIEASVVSEYIFLVGSGLVRYLYRTVDICWIICKLLSLMNSWINFAKTIVLSKSCVSKLLNTPRWIKM